MSTVFASRNCEMFGSSLVPWTCEMQLQPPNSPAVQPKSMAGQTGTKDFERIEVLDISTTQADGGDVGTTNFIPTATNNDFITVDVVEVGSESEDEDDDNAPYGFLVKSPPPQNSPDIEYVANPFFQADIFHMKREEELADVVPASSPVDEFFPDGALKDDYFACPSRSFAIPTQDPESPTVFRTPVVPTTATDGPTVRFVLNAASLNRNKSASNNVHSSTYAINQLIKRTVTPSDVALTRAWSAPSLMTKLAEVKQKKENKDDEETEDDETEDDERSDDGSEAILEKDRYVPPKGASLDGLDNSAMTLALLKAEYSRALAKGYRKVEPKPVQNITAEVTAKLRRSFTSPPGQWSLGKPASDSSSGGDSDSDGRNSEDDDSDASGTDDSEHRNASFQ